MRPIVRPPNPNNYPSVRLDTQQNMEADLQAIGVPDPGVSVRNGLGINSPAPVTMGNVVYGLNENVLNPRPKRKRDDPPPPPLTPLQAAEGDLREIVKEHYKEAILPLKARLGRFCSYCEQQISDYAPVEHVVPKHPYPYVALCWDNFLLSCNQCNSVKGERPNRGSVDLWNVLPPNPRTLDYYTAIRGHYIFPDNGPRTSTNIYSYSGLVPSLYFWDAATQTWDYMDPAISVRDGMTLLDPGNDEAKFVLVRIPFPPPDPPVDVYVRAQLVPSGAGATQAAASMTQMDLANDGAGKNGDNRMWDRTQRWVSAVESFSDLSVQWSDALFKSVCDNAGKGFLTTWVRVLELRGAGATPYPPDNTQMLLGAFLTRMTQQVANPRGPYPATDLTNLP